MLIENVHPPSPIAEHIVIDHVVFHELQLREIDVTAKTASNVRQVHTRYLSDQRDRSLKTFQFKKDVKMQVLNDDIDDVDKKIKQLQDTMNSLKKVADEYSFEAEEKTKIEDVKSLILQSNGLTYSVMEKEGKLKSFIENKKMLI